MEEKLNALCVRAIDYKDNDKLLTLCTLEKGKITAKITGCKAPKSKLRFAASPLCFGEYIFNESHGRYTVTGCTAYDNFYLICEDIQKYYSAFFILECVNKLTGDEVLNCRNITLLAVNVLKELCYGNKSALNLDCLFLLNVLDLTGYGLNLDKSISGRALSGKVYFDFTQSGMVASGEQTMDSVSLSAEGMECLLKIKSGHNVTERTEECTAFLASVLSGTCSIKLVTLSALLQK